ncbi:MAG: LPS-assembly protein LptD, partial [bacterium]|nr:LPS-assembly protein LptD [bacterium]
MKKKIILIMLILLAVGIVAEKKPTLVIRSADRKIITEDKLEAYKVEITWDEYIIYADYLEFNKKTNIIRAEGRVTMASKNTVISGDKLKFNIKEKTGEIYETSGRLAPSLSYTTDKLHQVDNETLTFKKFMFTTCTQCNPRWKITCSKGKIKKEKYIEMKNVFFKVKNIPIFYFPYLRYPVNKNGRSTGFLFPKIGTSSLKGFFLLNAFYWSLSEHADVTFHFDYFSRAGMGVAEEFRYINRKMEGNLKFYFIDYKDSIVFKDGTCPIDKNIFFSRNPADYSLNIQHNQNIDFLNTKIIATVDKQSDDNFKRLFSNDFYTTQKRISRSSVSIQSTLSNLKLSARASQNNTYDTINDSSSTITYLPTLGLNLKNQTIWKLPLYFSLDASYSIIKRVGKSYEEEEEELLQNIQSKRLRIEPSIKMNLLNLRWLNAALTIQTTHNYYPQSLALQTQEEEEADDAEGDGTGSIGNEDEESEVLGEDEEEDEEPEIVDVPLHLHYQSAVLNVKGPVLGRLYMLKHSKIKHLIEP